jgi:transposase
MIFGAVPPRIYIATRPIDFRKGMDGLAAAVQQVLKLDPFCGAAFIFRSKRADRLKILIWDGSGLILIYKRLDDTKFRWPRIEDGVMRLQDANTRLWETLRQLRRGQFGRKSEKRDPDQLNLASGGDRTGDRRNGLHRGDLERDAKSVA